MSIESMEKQKVTVGLSNFIQKHRLIIFILLGAMILAAVGLGVYIEVSKGFATTDVLKVEALSKKISAWSTAVESKKAALSAEIESDLATQGESIGYQYAKAQYYFKGGHFWTEKKDWQKALESFTKVLEVTQDNYLTPVALLNIIQAQEELGQGELALGAAEKFLEKYKDQIILAPQVYFTKARILDQSGKTEEAIAAFQALVDAFPDSDWTNLARTRIIQMKK